MTGWFSLREDGWFGSITISYFTFGRLPNQENLKSSLGAIAEFRPSKWQFSSSAPFWGGRWDAKICSGKIIPLAK